MTHWKTQFNYDYLGAYSLPDGKDIILTIRETKREQVVGASGKKEECFVAYFFENVKPMILNRTNCKPMTKIFKTPNFEEWINKQIQIGAVMVDAFGEKVDSLRIRPFIPKVETLEKHSRRIGGRLYSCASPNEIQTNKRTNQRISST